MIQPLVSTLCMMLRVAEDDFIVVGSPVPVEVNTVDGKTFKFTPFGQTRWNDVCTELVAALKMFSWFP